MKELGGLGLLITINSRHKSVGSEWHLDKANERLLLQARFIVSSHDPMPLQKALQGRNEIARGNTPGKARPQKNKP